MDYQQHQPRQPRGMHRAPAGHLGAREIRAEAEYRLTERGSLQERGKAVNHLRKPVRYGAVALAGLAVLVIAVLVIAGVLWLRASAGITIHGQVEPPPADTFVLGVQATSYAGCAQLHPRPRTRVTVTDPSGKVIGSGSLGDWSRATTRVRGVPVPVYTCRMPFTITGVPHEQSYGFQFSDFPGTIWVTKVSKPVLVNLSAH
jgi:hypothetical protein